MKKTVEIMFKSAPNAAPVKAQLTFESEDGFVPSGEGSEGFMLVKTATGSAWQEQPVIPTIPSAPTVDGEYKLVVSEGISVWSPIV
jgi:hypothetical protein